MKRFTLLFLMVLMVFFFLITTATADEYDDVTKQLNDLKQSLDSSQKATQTNETNLKKLNDQLVGIKNKVYNLEKEITKKEKEVKDGEKALQYQKTLLDQRTISYYKNLDKNEFSLVSLLMAENMSNVIQNFFYQKQLIDEDRKMIVKIVLYVKDLEEKKKTLESEQAKLAAIKVEIDRQSKFLSGEVAKSKQFEGELQKKIAQLSEKQQQLLAQKLASLHVPTSAATTQGGCSDDRSVDPGFGGTRFAFFTFGVFNRVGLNQYGAKGRAEAGQNAEQILNAYYNNITVEKNYNTGINITVNGTNEYGQTFNNQTWDIENYVKHVYEMPTGWHQEALRAQAVAARTYALALTDNGSKPIKPNQDHQVVKQEENTQAWKDAVDATRGWVMTQGGKPISAWFSSTHGGYVYTSEDIGWSASGHTKRAQDTSAGVGSFADLMNNAYDKSSPWFYCDWGSRSQYNKTAWLKSEEVADIVNVVILAKKDPSFETVKHLSQVDKSNPDGVDTWDFERVKSELKNRGETPFNSITDAVVDWDKGLGSTTSITFSGDGRSVTFGSKEFIDFFNVRAPANIQILRLRSARIQPLFNVEKR